jgi:hypothetical protein
MTSLALEKLEHSDILNAHVLRHRGLWNSKNLVTDRPRACKRARYLSQYEENSYL